MEDGGYPKIIATIVVVAIIAMGALYGYSLISEEIEGEHTATIIIDCTSDHEYLAVDATLEITGLETESFTLAQEETIQKTVAVTWKGTHTKEITLTLRTENGFWEESDTKTITVAPDGSYSVSLTA